MDLMNMTVTELEALQDAIKKCLTLKKKEVTAAKKVSGKDLVTGAPVGTMVRFMRKGVEMTAALVKVNATGITVNIEGKNCPIQGQLILGLAE